MLLATTCLASTGSPIMAMVLVALAVVGGGIVLLKSAKSRTVVMVIVIAGATLLLGQASTKSASAACVISTASTTTVINHSTSSAGKGSSGSHSSTSTTMATSSTTTSTSSTTTTTTTTSSTTTTTEAPYLLGSLVISKQSTASGTFTVTSIQARPAAGGPAISGQGSQVGNTENFSFPGITSGQWNIQIQVTLSDPTASLLWLSIPADFDLWAQPGGIGTQFIASTNNPITVSGSTTLNLSATEG